MSLEKEKKEVQDGINAEPKKVLVNMVIIPMIREIQLSIASAWHPRVRASLVYQLEALLSVIGEETRNALKDQYDLIQQYKRYPNTLLDERPVVEVATKIIDHLYTGILREVGVRPLNPKAKPFGEQENG